ncbi:MAG TPA: HrpE/YscL family type III secretion apparatus protein [Noviherbaspirillum sp.]
MNSFCVDTISDNPHLRASHGILKSDALPISANARRAAQLLMRAAQADAEGVLSEARSEAGALVEDAHKDANDILGKARAEAERILADARKQAQQLTAAEQKRAITQAAELLRSLQQANDTILERVEDIVVSLAQTLYDRLVMDTTPQERIGAALKRVLLEAPPKLVDALLRVHPEDAALLPELDWPVKADATLVPGACRLEASNGQWCANFDAAVQAVKAALAQGVEDARRGTPSEDGTEDGVPVGQDDQMPDEE